MFLSRILLTTNCILTIKLRSVKLRKSRDDLTLIANIVFGTFLENLIRRPSQAKNNLSCARNKSFYLAVELEDGIEVEAGRRSATAAAGFVNPK